ncbi:uncharacterized protein LOC128737348 [Sabethes cyaneus]|uniref:uncharacterized protein LOC128737348 n=1 Tax=Sabethes cyaneus TaxID=53552 RepID=UPI00237E773C|nr:uncharacterized protein LOC128737348 [Sabethes cyaneus]
MFALLCHSMISNKLLLQTTRFSAIRSFNVKNSMKLGFPCAYTDEETRKILNTLNEQDVEQLYKYDISKSRLKRIEIWRKKFGTFMSLEQVLELDGFGITVLRRFYDSIITSPKDNVMVPPKVAKKDPTFTTPTFPGDLATKVQSCVSLYIGLDFVTWAKFHIANEKPTVLNGWNSFAIPDRKLHISDLIRMVNQINRLIPEGDVYVVENPAVAQTVVGGSALKTNINIQKSQLIAMIMLMLTSRTRENIAITDNIFFLKQFTSARLFEIFVGTERVSCENVVRSLLECQVGLNEGALEQVQSKVIVPSGLKILYEEKHDAEREFLGQSLLLGLTFVRLCIVQCKNSLNILRK